MGNQMLKIIWAFTAFSVGLALFYGENLEVAMFFGGFIFCMISIVCGFIYIIAKSFEASIDG